MSPGVDLIIQARVGSSRLPRKSLMDLSGAPLVGRILERVKRCREVDKIVLAIPDTEENIPLRKIGEEYKVKVFEGSENDLVERYIEAAKREHTKHICRLPADNATPEPSEIDRMIRHHLSLKKRGFSSNLSEIKGSGYPDGIGVEIFDFELLCAARERYCDPARREHVHLNFYNYDNGLATDEEWCPISTIECPKEFRRPDLVLDVNTESQYLFMKDLYEYLYPKNANFTIVDIIDWYDNIYSIGD